MEQAMYERLISISYFTDNKLFFHFFDLRDEELIHLFIFLYTQRNAIMCSLRSNNGFFK